MEKKKKKIILLIIPLCFLLLFLLYHNFFNGNKKKEKTTVENLDSSISLFEEDSSIDWESLEKKEIVLKESLVIEREGVYYLSGMIEDGLLTIHTTGNVKLILNNVSITNTRGPAIFVENAKNVYIYLEDGSVNTLEDGKTYSESFDTDVEGVLFSKEDLILDGTGTLKIKANYQDGIVSKDNLKIRNGIYEIDSLDDGIRGKDSLSIVNGNFQITSKGDALKATNDVDPSKGYILIANGSFSLLSASDGIQAETKLRIENGSFTIKTGSGSENSSTNSKGIWESWNQKTESNISAKGLKAGDNLVILNGNFHLDTEDDAMHSNNSIGIKKGTFSILSGDDGIHADTQLVIDGGDIQIKKSYEGVESAKISINDGNIYIQATDDGINVAAGTDSSSINRPGANQFNKNTENTLTINGGVIQVDASGDGIDVNGSAYINGGEILILGPTDNRNGALDYDQEFVVTGGSLLAFGSSGMATSISSTSTQYGVLILFSTSNTKETSIKIVNSNNLEILDYTPNKVFSSLVFSSEKLEKGETYTIYLDGETYTTFRVNQVTTTVGERENQMFGGPGGERGKEKNQKEK